ncbi:MAG: 1-acyl-sn-glycerol-3-phosphate acyltransferase [Myxococcales bacterium]|nr:1-acyl-sn-glycerol-3-phosphate acyltransferase [Myxococcales bacterium]
MAAAFRAFGRSIVLIVWSATCWLAFEVRQGLGSHPPAPRNPWFQRWARGALRILGVRRIAAEKPPSGVFMLVSNHLSYLDIVVYAAETGATFVSKAEVGRWPIVGFLTKRIGTLLVDRGSPRDTARVVDSIRDRLEAGSRVVVFPEATSSDGRAVLPFRAPLFAAAIRSGSPVVCGALRYEVPERAPPVSESVCWWGEMTFPGHVLRLLGISSIRAKLSYATLVHSHDERRTLAEQAHRRVVELHDELVGNAPSASRGTV